MSEKYVMYAMMQAKPGDELVAGLTYFTSWKPWQSYRLSGAIHILSITEDNVYYNRQKYRHWGNFYKSEPEYTSGTIVDQKIYLTNFFRYPGYKAMHVRGNDCIFEKNDEKYIIGKTVDGRTKTHALKLGTNTMWNGQKYTSAYYFCSDVEMSGLTETVFSKGNGDVTTNLNTVKQQMGIITCSNCLRKLA